MTTFTATARAKTHLEPRFDEQFPPVGRSTNPIDFPGYEPPSGTEESVRAGVVHAPGGDYVLIVCDFSHMGGTMGVVAGEAVVRAYGYAVDHGLPVAHIISSGGARLQEGFFALMQMGRTASAAAAHRDAGLRSASAFRSPTTGGVFASWGNTTDVRAASPEAVIGFGGPRVVETVTGAWPPRTSHTAHAALSAGIVDAIVDDADQQTWLEVAIGVRSAAPLLREPWVAAPESTTATGWDAVLRAREPGTPSGMDWAGWIVDEWFDLSSRSPVLRTGVARIGEVDAVVIAMDRDRTHVADSRRPRLPDAADFRTARRAIDLAHRTRLGVLTLIDTPGADPSPPSEADGLAREISLTLISMARLAAPSVAICVGEGGSGGAMALAHADVLYALEGSVFPVIGPEAGAAVLYRDRDRAPQLAAAMQITANELQAHGLIDGVLAADPATVRSAVVGGLTSGRTGGRTTRADAATRAALETW